MERLWLNPALYEMLVRSDDFRALIVNGHSLDGRNLSRINGELCTIQVCLGCRTYYEFRDSTGGDFKLQDVTSEEMALDPCIALRQGCSSGIFTGAEGTGFPSPGLLRERAG